MATIPPSEVLLQSPYLLRLSKRGKLAPSHLTALLEAAGSPKKPKEPKPWDCCGSSCKPCVKELWRMEVKGWEECHENGEEEEEEEQKGVKKSREGTPKIEIGIEKEVDSASLDKKLEALRIEPSPKD